MAYWGIDSHHINIGNGDCSIHVLVWTDQNGKKFGIRCVLIDGGSTMTSLNPNTNIVDVNPIRKTINWLNIRYDWGPQGSCKFNSIVITHWDEDHYGGVFRTIAEDALKYGMAIPYLFYDKMAGNTVPATFLYCPNWNSGTRLNGAPVDYLDVKNGYGCINTSWKGSKYTTAYTWVYFCLVSSADRDPSKGDISNVLGVEFFGHRKCNNIGAVQSLDDLVKNNPPDPYGMPTTVPLPPQMYCIAVQQQVPGPNNLGVILEDPTITNRVSIACIILWPQSYRISHYLAGDADQVTEDKILNWLQGNNRKPTFRSMKISHHGSRSSTPLDMVFFAKPYNIVISNPSSRHVHPSCEIMLYLFLWTRLWKLYQNFQPRVLATKYPHFLAVAHSPHNANGLVYTKAYRISIKSFQESKQSPYSPYWGYMAKLYDLLNQKILPFNQPVQNQLALYNKVQGGTRSDYQMKQWVADQLSQIWGDLCHPGPISHPAFGSGYVYPGMQNLTQNNSIDCIIIQCRDNDDTDGAVSHKFYNMSDPRQYNRFTNMSVVPISVTTTNANNAGGPFNFFTTNLFTASKPPSASIIATREGDDGTYLYMQRAAVITGTYNDTEGTDPNEDEIDGSDETVAGSTAFWDPLTLLRSLPARKIFLLDNNNEYCFYASRIDPASIKISAYSRLTSGTALDTFIGALHCGNICLPGPNAPVANNTMRLLDSDEFGNYVEQAVDAQGSFSAMIGNGPSISGFSLAMRLTSRQSSIVASTKQPLPSTSDPISTVLYFSTNAVQDSFATTSPLPGGLLPKSNILIFGLDTSPWTEPSTITLLQLVTFTRIQYLVDSQVIRFLRDIKLTISKDQTKGRRNAVWFEPLNSYNITLRLQFDLDCHARTQLNSYLGALKGLSIVSASMIARRSSKWAPNVMDDGTPGATINYDGSLIFYMTCIISNIQFSTVLELYQDQVKLELILETRQDALQMIFDFLKPILNLDGDKFSFTDWMKQPAGNTSFLSPALRRMTVVLNYEATSKGVVAATPTANAIPGVSSVTIDFETGVKFASGEVALFLATYQWAPGTGSNLLAQLWCSPGSVAAIEERSMLPEYEAYSYMQPVTIDTTKDPWPAFLDLSKIGGFENIPKEIPNEVTQATLSIGQSGIAFGGTMVCDPAAGGGVVPRLYLGQLYLDAAYIWNQGPINATLGMTAVIMPAPGSKNGTPAQVQGEISFDNGTWKVFAMVTGVYGSILYQFFDNDSQSAVASILDNIEIQTLGIVYSYAPGGAASSFLINGVLMLGSLQLALNFNYDSSGWTFDANLLIGTDDPGETTVGAIVQHIFGEAELPDFVSDIPVKPPKVKDAVGVDIKSATVPNCSDKSLFFTAYLDFDGISFQAFQYQPATPVGQTNRPPVQRAFAVSIGGLPAIDIDLIGNITQPFDEMLFLYVQPQTGDGANLGLTYGDVNAINAQQTVENRKKLPYKVTKKTYTDSDVVLSAGAHFILVLKNSKGESTVVLDYVFFKPDPPSSMELGEQSLVPVEGPTDSRNPGSAKTPYEKTIGPITIRNMGLKYASGPPPTLSILMDASIVLGPIGLGLIGFSLDISFPKGITLHTLPEPGFSLNGLAVAFDRPPLLLAGMFERIKTDTPDQKMEAYQGAIALTFVPYLVQAAGYYGKTTPKNKPSFISTFVYFILNGPLITFEFAEIDGITGGFGYNTDLQYPNAANVIDFPFLASPSGTDPNSALSTLMSTGWFSARDGSFWLAAGLTVTAFEMLQVKAVVVIQWDPKITLGLFGVATADMPAGVENKMKFLHVQLGIVATVDFNAGILKIEGQLTPASYVLNPSCHLTGGFALYSWFASDDPTLKGDWVFTIGGYHQSYHRPDQYPNPPRLGINWAYDSSISIKGEAYFAITPKVCMGGGRLDVSLSLGPLYAFFDAYADFLINYKPFHFAAQGGLSVGVQFTLDLWICTLHINVEIGATLYLQGPPLAGRVHVDFWVFGFDINFGDTLDGTSIDALLLEPFYDLILQSALPNVASAAKAITSSAIAADNGIAKVSIDDDGPVPHVFSCNNGLIPNGSTTLSPNAQNLPWNVRGAVFQFTIACKFAIDSATIITGQLDPNAPKLDPLLVPGNGQPIYAKPMELVDKLSSLLTVTITPVAPSTSDLAGASDEKVARWDEASTIIKYVPSALWGIYKKADDPNKSEDPNPNQNRNLLDGSNPSVPLPMGLLVSSPNPVLSSDIIPAFSYNTFFIEDVTGSPFPFPAIVTADPAWYPTVEDPNQDEWEEVRTQWSGTPGLGNNAAQIVVNLWASLSFCQWDVTPADVGVLSGKAPAQLLDSKVFSTLYLEAPRMGAAMA